ncbi:MULTISPECIES: Scr1 family TA system antitoxin-like transcriptional regulator [unclassified Streptomyces]|uniref:helix-turn-helix domain-containing protein n=1 Tax=unclassified Streptomyces TaxID=2593676 RepID=UPI003650A325
MTKALTGPVSRMRIARGLQALRKRASLTQVDVAKAAGVSVGTVNRYESWQDAGTLRIPTMRSIATACEATADEHAELEDLVRAQPGWWLDHPTRPSILDPLIAMEAYADTESVWASTLVPGLLQTPAYAEAIHRAADPTATAADVGAHIATKSERQRRVRESPLHLHVVLDEVALRRAVGGPVVMVEQINHLLALSEQPTMDLRILPAATGATPAGPGGHFVVVGRDDPRPLAAIALVYLELHRGGLYLDGASDLTHYRTVFQELKDQAFTPAETRQALITARQEYQS